MSVDHRETMERLFEGFEEYFKSVMIEVDDSIDEVLNKQSHIERLFEMNQNKRRNTIKDISEDIRNFVDTEFKKHKNIFESRLIKHEETLENKMKLLSIQFDNLENSVNCDWERITNLQEILNQKTKKMCHNIEETEIFDYKESGKTCATELEIIVKYQEARIKCQDKLIDKLSKVIDEERYKKDFLEEEFPDSLEDHPIT